MKNHFYFILIASLFFTACKPSIKPENLYGKWKYTRVQNPDATPPDSVTSIELNTQTPYIQFTQKDSLLIYWGGAVLARGTFRIDGQNIQYNELLPGGHKREFPFFVSELTNKRIIFSTKGKDGSEVTAVKE
jgi:hypothetical protein